MSAVLAGVAEAMCDISDYEVDGVDAAVVTDDDDVADDEITGGAVVASYMRACVGWHGGTG